MLTFEELYNQYAEDVYRFAVWLCRDPMEAEDITAETFVRAWLRFSAIRMETLKGYLFKIARNHYLSQQRKAARKTELLESIIDTAPGPEGLVQTRLALAGIDLVLGELPECDRTAFILRVRYELSYGEIGRVLDVSEVAARVKVHRIRKRLLHETVRETIS